MKTKMLNRFGLGTFLGLILAGSSIAQDLLPQLQYYRYNDRRGLHVFETPKTSDVEFEGIKLRVGGDFALQFQGLSNENTAGTLIETTNNFTLPSANFNMDIQLAKGVRMHLRTYLSSRHHNEAWVKGGYFQIDNLDFISEGLFSGVMEVVTFRFGMDDINYGDAHFRRSDNARVSYNAFVENYIMDSFTTEPFGEVTVQSNGILGVLGVTNGRLNQVPQDGDNGFAYYLKLGYDKQMNEDLRFRLTGSYYHSNDHGTRDYLYGGDRAGSRYYEILNAQGETSFSDFEPRFNPNWAYQAAYQINPFVKFQGLEFFGVFENSKNGNDAVGGAYTQLGGELIYRFGSREQLYLGTRLNSVNGFASDAAEDADQKRTIKRTAVAAGWYMTDNVMLKLEYVGQKYEGDSYTGTKFEGAKFDGFMVEAAISF